jgi:hypothetical protein
VTRKGGVGEAVQRAVAFRDGVHGGPSEAQRAPATRA